MPRIRWISGMLLTGVATAPAVVTFAADSSSLTSSDTTGDIERLQSVLISPASTSDERDEAARRLIARNASDARARALADLDQGNSQIQSSLASAVSSASDPDPNLIPILGRLLGSKGELTRPAAMALVNYRDQPEAFNLLRKFASNVTNANQQRIEVIRAMGSVVDQSFAAFLIGLLQSPKENAALQRAATDALGAMTALPFGSNIDAWVNWWTNNAANWSSDHFVAELQKIRERRTTQLQSRHLLLSQETAALLGRNYSKVRDKLSTEEAAETLLSYLNSKSPEIRIIGAGLVANDFSTHPPAEQVKSRLLEMIGDSDDTVRLAVIIDLRTINDARAVEPLLDQLAVERDGKIKMQIVAALGKSEDLRTVRPLLKALHDPQSDVATAAARALAGPLGEKVWRSDPRAAAGASAALRKMVDDVANLPGANQLRAACMAALATLRDPRSADTFNKFLKPGETPDVQRAAIDGFGNLGDTKWANLLAQQLDSDDRTIRLAAAQALLTVATPSEADTLNAKLKSETDREVSDAIWKAFKGLFDKESPEQLRSWAAQFQNEPRKRLETLIALAGILQKNQRDDDLASTNQNIADAYMQLDPPQPSDAIASLQKALDYWQQKDPHDATLAVPIGDMIQYQLKAKLYSAAVAFGATQIKANPIYQRDVIGPLSAEAGRLAAGDVPDAQIIINGVLSIPDLASKYVDEMNDVKQQIKDQNSKAPR